MQKRHSGQRLLPPPRPLRAANDDQARPDGESPHPQRGWDPYHVWRTRIRDDRGTRR